MSQLTDEQDVEHEQIPTETREKVLDRDGHRCQLCNAAGRTAGGSGGAVLQVHHKQYDPEAWDVNDLENLISLCRACHNWAHKRPSTSEVPVLLCEEAETMLLEHDYEILQLLGSRGPLTTTELVDGLTTDMSSPAVRERLWLLMGLDVVCESQDTQVLDQDAKTSEWGLPTDITTSERGRIPEDRQTLIQRVEDERVRRALDRGCSREEVASVLDLHPRTTWHKERRARAYGFPLDAFTSHGRPATESTDSESEGASASETANETSGQQDQPLQALLVEQTGESAEGAVQARAAHVESSCDAIERSDDAVRVDGRQDHASGGDGQTPVETINELDEIEDLDHLDLGELSPQVRSMVETLAAKLDSRDEIDGGECRLVK